MIAPFERMPRPRHVSIRATHLAVSVVGWVSFIALVIYLARSTAFFRSPGYADAVVFCWMIGVAIYALAEEGLKLGRDRKLFMDGEVTLARVFHISGGRNRRMQFRFEDQTSRTFTASTGASSRPRSISKGSAIVVFYDPSDPQKRCVPLCTTLWKIDLPSDSTAVRSSPVTRK